MKKIDIGWVDGGLVHGKFTQSLVGLIMKDNVSRKLIESVHRSFGSGISVNRNSVVSSFLKGSSDYLLFIDSDTVWNIDNIYKMYDFCENSNYMAVTGICVLEDGVPAIFKKSANGVGYRDISPFELHMNDYLEVDACGMAAFMAHRKIFLDTSSDSLSGPYWYYDNASPEGFFNETISFCKTIEKSGYKIAALPEVKIPHIKNIELTYSY